MILVALLLTVTVPALEERVMLTPQFVGTVPPMLAVVNTLVAVSRLYVIVMGLSAVVLTRHVASGSLMLKLKLMTFAPIDVMFGSVPVKKPNSLCAGRFSLRTKMLPVLHDPSWRP